MKRIDWYYHRAGCMTCKRAQDFLDGRSVDVGETVNARKERLGNGEALELAGRTSELLVARGKTFERISLKKGALTDPEILKRIMGPTGNLRAPTLIVGKKMLVGFNREMYETVFD